MLVPRLPRQNCRRRKPGYHVSAGRAPGLRAAAPQPAAGRDRRRNNAMLEHERRVLCYGRLLRLGVYLGRSGLICGLHQHLLQTFDQRYVGPPPPCELLPLPTNPVTAPFLPRIP